MLREATLGAAAVLRAFGWYGKQGRHSEHLGYLLAEMQSLHRAPIAARAGRAAMTAIREYPTFVAAPAAIEARVRAVLAAVPDPEIPVLSVLDLGVVRAVELSPDGEVGSRCHPPTQAVPRPR